jgi:hypothetical protein
MHKQTNHLSNKFLWGKTWVLCLRKWYFCPSLSDELTQTTCVQLNFSFRFESLTKNDEKAWNYLKSSFSMLTCGLSHNFGEKLLFCNIFIFFKLTLSLMSILWKMPVFIENPPVTSSNCYETMKNASILIKLGTNVDWTIVLVTTCLVLNFLLPWQRGDISKLPKSLFCLDFFPSKLISKCCNF